MFPARFLEPWEVLEVNLQNFSNTSDAGNEHVLLVVDRASRFPFACPLPPKEVQRVARLLLDLCLTFGVPSSIRADGGGGIHSGSSGIPTSMIKSPDKVRTSRPSQGAGKRKKSRSLDARRAI